MELSTSKLATELAPKFTPRLTGVFTARRVAALTTVAVTSLVMILGTRTAPGWSPTTDWALIELRVRDVGRSFPLLGAPSAFGFHHPGPLMYLMLAPVYRLAGSNPAALILSTAAVNCVAIVGCAWTAWRRGGLIPVLYVLTLSVGLTGSAEPGFLFDSWNPWLAVLWFLWFLLLAWSALDGDALALPVGAFVGSFVVQAHVSYVVPVLGVAVAVAAISIARRYRHHTADDRPTHDTVDDPSPRDSGRTLLGIVTAITIVLVWAGPIFEQFARDPGNLTQMARILGNSEGRGELVGMRGALGIVARELAWNGPWTGSPEQVGLFKSIPPAPMWNLLAPLVVVIATSWLVRSRRRPLRGVGPRDEVVSGIVDAPVASPRSLLIVNVIAGLLFVAAISRVEVDRVFTYVVRGLWVVAGLLALTLVLAAVAEAATRWPRWSRQLGASATATGAVLLTAGAIRLATHANDAQLPIYQPEISSYQIPCNQRMVAAVRADAGDGGVHISSDEFWPVHAGPLINELDRAGTDVTVSPHLTFYVDRPGQSPSDDAAAYTVIDLNGRPTRSTVEGRLVAKCDGLTANERRFVDAVARTTNPSARDIERAFSLTPRNFWVAVYRR